MKVQGQGQGTGPGHGRSARRHTDLTASAMDLETAVPCRRKKKKSSSDSDRSPVGRLPRYPGFSTEPRSSRNRKGLQNVGLRGFQGPPSCLFDDDPGIMSEVETASTGFRRGGKQRSSLPVVRTPSKTLERPLGLVFLQYRNETKRALLPNEITSLDTVKALFVRSFPKQLSMDYLDNPQVRVYIHDSNKDMFYELEELRDVKDRSVLRIYEADAVNGGPPVGQWDDQSYFSEPEFDGEYQHQHVHRAKPRTPSGSTTSLYSGGTAYPQTATISRGGGAPPKPQRVYGQQALIRTSPRPPPGQHLYTNTSTERSYQSPYLTPSSSYEDPYYGTQYPPRSGSVTPIIDDEASGFRRLRVESMERQLANLTGLVQRALTTGGGSTGRSPSGEFLQIPTTRDEFSPRRDRPPKLGKDKSVSFEKSVSFSEDPPEIGSPKQHSPQHAVDKPTKPAIKSSTLPRMSSQERDKFKPTPPPKPASLLSYYDSASIDRELHLSPEMYNQLRLLQKKAKELKMEMRNLRRLSQSHALNMREAIRDTASKLRVAILSSGDNLSLGSIEMERVRMEREEEMYRQDIGRLETDLTDLEVAVEDLRGNVINRRTKVNMSDVENMALVLSKASKSVADLKIRFPGLQEGMRNVLAQEMEKVVIEEKFLKEEPDRLETALRRCKKLTGTLVTLKRLASVQEQRTLPGVPTSIDSVTNKGSTNVSTSSILATPATGEAGAKRSENPLDALLDELQTFPAATLAPPPVRRLPSFPSTDSASSPIKQTPSPSPVPPPHGIKKVPPPPPPRTSSKSPLVSPVNHQFGRSLNIGSSATLGRPVLPLRAKSDSSYGTLRRPPVKTVAFSEDTIHSSNSSSSESINSQEGLAMKRSGANYQARGANRQEFLEHRHQELLRKQKQLQEQYARLQHLQSMSPELKKTGSESNLLGKLGLGQSLSTTTQSGSLTHLPISTKAAATSLLTKKSSSDDATSNPPASSDDESSVDTISSDAKSTDTTVDTTSSTTNTIVTTIAVTAMPTLTTSTTTTVTTSKIYETDIL